MDQDKKGWHSSANAAAYQRFSSQHKMYESLSDALLGAFTFNHTVHTACDLGCGIGISTCVLRKFLGKNTLIFGYDSSHAMLDIARQQAAGVGISFADYGPPTDILFDLIFANASFWQFSLQDQKKWLSTALKPGGAVLYNVPAELENDKEFQYLVDADSFRRKISNNFTDFRIVRRTYSGTVDEAIAFLRVPIFMNNASPGDFTGAELFDADWIFIKATKS